jgi:O-glycosyl hydrolase
MTRAPQKRAATLTLLTCLIGAVSAAPATRDASAHHDVVDTSRAFQTIDNFGASDAWTIQMLGKWETPARDRAAELLFSKDKGIGLSCWRFNIGGGVQMETIPQRFRTAETFEVSPGKYDWTRQAGEQWFLRKSAEYGVEQRLAFVNSPPGRMTRSGLTNAGKVEGPTNFKDGMEGAYATYLADILDHFRAESLAFDYISPLNEPQVDWNGKQEGCRMDNVTIARVTHAVAEEFQRRGLPAKLISPESATTVDMARLSTRPTTRWGYAVGDYIDVLSADPEFARASGKTLCHHLYNAFEGPNLFTACRELHDKMAKLPDWKIWMSEICIMHPKRDLGMDSALTLAKMMHAVMSVEGASAFQWWLAVSPYDYRDGLLYTTWQHPGDEEDLTESKMLWAFGNFSRFIRPGWRRVALSGEGHSETGLMASAYVDPTGEKVAAVYVNTLPAPQRVHLASKDGPWTSLRAFETSAAKNLEESTTQDGWATVPAHSVVTLLAEK